MAVVINVPAVSRGTRECTRPSMCASGVPYRTRDKRCGVGGKSAATVRPVTSTPRVGSTIPSFFLRHEEGMVSERPPKSCRHAYRSSRSLKTSVCALVDLFPPSPRRSNAYPRGVVERDQFSPEQERKQRDALAAHDCYRDVHHSRARGFRTDTR